MGSWTTFFTRTLLLLIPKVSVPEFFTQLRPISLCIVPYKILSKVIVNRLKPMMPLLVAENQTNFVTGRHIMDNVVVAQEVIHSMQRKERVDGFEYSHGKGI